MTNKYFAFSIGPIYGTFEQAKKTRTVWASSYFFSWFIKQLVTKTSEANYNIMLPYHKEIMKSNYGAGMYADRIYFIENSSGNLDGLKSITQTIVSEIVDDICERTTYKDKQEVGKFLKDYLNLHFVETSYDETDPENKEVPALMYLNNLLDNKELKVNYSFEISNNPLLEYLETGIHESDLITKDAFDDPTKKRFRSIPEISSTSLERQNKDAYDQLLDQEWAQESHKKRIGKTGKPEENNILKFDFLTEVEKSVAFKESFRPYHKYFGVLYADGDNISSLLHKVAGEPSSLLKFSKLLLDFAKEAEKSIVDYGGNGIYLGGEDILAFLPLACKNKQTNALQTIFSLIDKLDVHFYNTLGKYAEEMGVIVPTLSYGIMISYVKHPLKESMQIAHRLLEDSKNKDKHPSKNTIGLRFQKHSGQVTECFIERTTDKLNSWEKIKTYTEKYTQNLLNEKQTDLLNSVMHRINDNIFYSTFTGAAKANRLDSFFANFFDEDLHKTTEKNAYLTEVRKLAEIILSEYGYDDSDKKNYNTDSRSVLFTVLRLVQFINSEKE